MLRHGFPAQKAKHKSARTGVETPNGDKGKRYIDLQGKKDGETESFQIGKANKNGSPVSRENKALNDIEDATGKRPAFVPYNNSRPN